MINLEIIEKLSTLQKWDCDSGERFAGVDWEKDSIYGEWIKKEDVDKLIDELKKEL